MARAIVGVLDSLGVGAAPDAARFGDDGADTFGHILAACASGAMVRKDKRVGPLAIPHLEALGFGLLAQQAARRAPAPAPAASGMYGYAAERSFGKDTPSGHWEMMGLPVEYDWGFFPAGPPSFPASLLADLCTQAGLPGVLGDCHASGTTILDEWGEEHIRTGKPIVYTSADSVFQIAAHEQHFGLQRLYDVCTIARRLVDAYRVGRVIARPFVGAAAGAFQRTAGRKDLTTPPHAPTLLDIAKKAGREVIGIGKISDIFAGKGLTRSIKADGNMALFDAMLREIESAPDGALIFVNFVDFDTLFGHRRDVAGYAHALEAFDARVPDLQRALRPGDLAVLTADHGCDPSFPGSDHTREFVPILAFGPGIAPRALGQRESFADIGQSLATHLSLPKLGDGVSFLAA
jgi:phosphopentomutase